MFISLLLMASLRCLCCPFFCVLWSSVIYPADSEDQSAEASQMQARVLLPIQPGSSPKPRIDSPREMQLKVRFIRHFTAVVL